MKKSFIKFFIKLCKKEKEYSQEEIEIMKYALEGLYLTFSKIIIITLLAFILGIIKHYMLFMAFYIPIRAVSFGWHANTTKQCWIFSIIAFLFIPYLASIIKISNIITYILMLYNLLMYVFFAPADSKKRPIINKKRRLFFKMTSIIINILYFILIINYQAFSNYMILALTYQTIIISPLLYKITGQSYNNYKTYNLN